MKIDHLPTCDLEKISDNKLWINLASDDLGDSKI